MTLPRLLTCTLLLTGCIVPDKSLGEGETGESDPTGGADEGDDDGGTLGATGQNEGDDGPSPTTGADGGDGPAPGTDGPGSDGGTGSDSGADTGPPTTCEIVPVAIELSEQSKTPPLDCGDVTFDDEEEAWIAAHDCAATAAAQTEAFRLIVDMQGIDSLPRRAFVGQVGFAYAMTQLDQDMGGLAPDPSPVTYRSCDEILPIVDCLPTVGDICLVCNGRTDGDVWCEGT